MIAHFTRWTGSLDPAGDEQLAGKRLAVRTVEDKATRLCRLAALAEQQYQSASHGENQALQLHVDRRIGEMARAGRL